MIFEIHIVMAIAKDEPVIRKKKKGVFKVNSEEGYLSFRYCLPCEGWLYHPYSPEFKQAVISGSMAALAVQGPVVCFLAPRLL